MGADLRTVTSPRFVDTVCVPKARQIDAAAAHTAAKEGVGAAVEAAHATIDAHLRAEAAKAAQAKIAAEAEAEANQKLTEVEMESRMLTPRDVAATAERKQQEKLEAA